EIVLLPWRQARHPDHRAAHALISRALFFSNVKKFETDPHRARFKAKQILYYQMRNRFRPSFIVDISGHFDKKLKAIRCYSSQFQRNAKTLPTLLNSSKALDHVE
ncbi:MAG: bacillithiol biosynthesis deacetylase BshB1, partial [Planctomycetota bacterium]|nr:bacillithiol biosynthesis deacetylase BshB1 [Planctomycetota bacterium]